MKGQRPILTQLGPYAYDEYYVKFDIEWTDDGDTVTYYTQKYYLFNKDETLPGLSEHDNITLPYVTAIGFEYLLNTIPVEADVLLDAALDVRASFFVVLVFVLFEFSFSAFLLFAVCPG
jgi:hypothetical protein